MPPISRPYTPTLYSGDVIVRLTGPTPPGPEDELVEPPFPTWLADAVHEILEEVHPGGPPAPVERLVRSRPPLDVLALEQAAATGSHPPIHSLTSYFRVWLRDRPPLGRLLVDGLVALPGVDRAWLETTAYPAARRLRSPPVAFATRPPHALAAPIGVGPDRVSGRPGGDGAGVSVYVLESGWRRRHANLTHAQIAAPLWGDDAGELVPGDVHTQDWANHGTSTLGVLVASSRCGLVPRARVRLVSCLDTATESREHVADGIVAALGEAPPGAVLLLEVQRGGGLPTEVEDPDLDAIRLATSRGVTVLEPAGNGGHDLDRHTSPHPLDPASPGFVDSGAIVVGALAGTPAAVVAPWSSRGRRVDAWAHGAGVVTTGAAYGTPVRSVKELDRAHRDDYGGTSAAAAIVAGVTVALAGVEAHRPAGRAHPVDLRARLRGVTAGAGARKPRLPDLGLLAASPLPRTRGLPAALPLPPPLQRPRSRPATRALAVGHPQTSEGNTNVRSGGSTNDTLVASVHLPSSGVAGQQCLPGATPPSGGATWAESWKYYSLEQALGKDQTPPFKSFWFHLAPNPTSPTANPPPVVATATLSFQYAAVPATAPTPPGAGYVQGHFDVFVTWSGARVRAGQMRRFINHSTRSAWEVWLFNASYRFPSEQHPVEVSFVLNASPTGFAAWFDDCRTGRFAPTVCVEITYRW